MFREKIVPGEYYHIYNRGNDKRNIFLNVRDYVRFLFLILYFRSPLSFYNLGRIVSYFVRHRVFNTGDEKGVAKSRYVDLIAFCLMPNHFHLIVREAKEKGISKYMQRVLDAYTKYFNEKYNRSGHLFQGPYQIVHVESNEQLIYLSAYIHRNPRELRKWRDREKNYPWSSYQDYIKEDRWSGLLRPQILLDQYETKKEYERAVDESGAKDKDESILC